MNWLKWELRFRVWQVQCRLRFWRDVVLRRPPF